MSSSDSYDASEVGERARSSHITAKDLKLLVIVVIGLFALGYPIWQQLKRRAQESTCTRNFGQVFKAVSLYLENNNDRYPPIYAEDGNGEPMQFDGRAAASWMTVIQDGMEKRSSFACPSAASAENAINLHYSEPGKTFESSYGMYKGWSTYISSMVTRPESSVLIAETSGSDHVLNPIPFKNGNDGISIAWNTGNYTPSTESTMVTRLAFGEMKNSVYSDSKPGRHDSGIHVLLANGKLRKMRGSIGNITRLGGKAGAQINGPWAIN